MSWENSLDDLLTHPYEEDSVMVDVLGNEIYEDEKYYYINGVTLSEDGLESCKVFILDDDEEECDECEKPFENDYYYSVDGMKLCDECIKQYEEVASRY